MKTENKIFLLGMFVIVINTLTYIYGIKDVAFITLACYTAFNIWMVNKNAKNFHALSDTFDEYVELYDNLAKRYHKLHAKHTKS